MPPRGGGRGRAGGRAGEGRASLGRGAPFREDMVAWKSLDGTTTKDMASMPVVAHVKLTLLVLTTTMLTAPFAAAGEMEASLSYMEGEERCGGWRYDAAGGNDSGSWGHWYSYSSWAGSCADSFSYARASVSDDDGSVASASADASSASGSRGERFEQAWWSRDNDSAHSGWSDSQSSASGSGTHRGANVSTREGSAGAAYGCSASIASDRHTSWSSHATDSYETTGSRYDHAETEESANRCGVDAGAHRGATSLRATPFESGCEGRTDYAYHWQDAQSGGSYYEEARQHYANDQQCRTGASADAGEAGAGAGWVDGCRYEQHESRSRHSAHDNATGYRYVSDSCRQGILAEGPDGMTLFVGRQSGTQAECEVEAEYCGTWQSSLVVSLEWAHNPLAPFVPSAVHVPLA